MVSVGFRIVLGISISLFILVESRLRIKSWNCSAQSDPNQMSGRPSCNVRRGRSRHLQRAPGWAQLSGSCLGRTWDSTDILSFRKAFRLKTFDPVRFSFFSPFSEKSPIAATMGRAMAYPYTIGAMLKAFPLKYHIDKSWIFKVMLQNAMNSNTNYFSMV